MISLDVLLDGLTVTVEPLAASQAGPDQPSVRACGDTGVLELVGGVRVCCSPASVVVLPHGARHDLALGRRGGERGVRTARGLIRATYRGSVGLFDALREPLAQPLEADDQIRRSFEEMLEELLAQHPGARAMAEALLRRWLILLFRRWWPAGPQPFWLAVLGDHRLGRVIAAMQERPQEAFTVLWLADTAGMSRSVFVEHFVEAIGHSPMEFLKTIRLDRAARLLTSTDLPVKGIARQVGYISRSSFTRAFVGAHGLGPAAFRAAARSPLAAADAWAPLPDSGRRARFDTACMARITPCVGEPTC